MYICAHTLFTFWMCLVLKALTSTTTTVQWLTMYCYNISRVFCYNEHPRNIFGFHNYISLPVIYNHLYILLYVVLWCCFKLYFLTYILMADRGHSWLSSNIQQAQGKPQYQHAYSPYFLWYTCYNTSWDNLLKLQDILSLESKARI